MTPERVQYQPITNWPRLTWPNGARITSLKPTDQESALIQRCLDALEAATGARSKGWIAPPIVSVPQISELDDVECLWHRRVPTPRWLAMLQEAVNVLAGKSGRVAVIGLRPWLFGIPHRIRYLDEGLQRVGQTEGLWATSVGEIAKHFRASQPAEEIL